MTANTFALPHGASGIEVGEFAIELRADKLVAIARDSGTHYTLHSGHASGVLDIHRTWRDSNGTEHHQTAFAMLRSDLGSLLADLSPLTIGMFRLFRRLRLGWLYRNNIDIVCGIDPILDHELTAVTRKRRRRLVVEESKLRKNTLILEYLEDIWDFPDGATFSLMRNGQKLGIGIKATGPDGCAHLYWLRLRDAAKFLNVYEDRFLATALKYAIPKERYKDYGVLEP